jgi:hypothetical protein
MQLEEDVLDLTRIKAALTGDVLTNFVYLRTVVKLDARCVGFDCIDPFYHNSHQLVHFEMSAPLESSIVGGFERG